MLEAELGRGVTGFVGMVSHKGVEQNPASSPTYGNTGAMGEKRVQGSPILHQFGGERVAMAWLKRHEQALNSQCWHASHSNPMGIKI